MMLDYGINEVSACDEIRQLVKFSRLHVKTHALFIK